MSRIRSGRKNQEIEPLVLPTAEGGNGELEYSLEGELPEGLEYDGGHPDGIRNPRSFPGPDRVHLDSLRRGRRLG